MNSSFFSQLKFDFVRKEGRNYFACCDLITFDDAISSISKNHSFIILLDIFCRLSSKTGSKSTYNLTYVFLDFEEDERLFLSVRSIHSIDSISHIWSNSNLLEQNLSRDYGVIFTGGCRPEIFYTNRENQMVHPLRYNLSGFDDFSLKDNRVAPYAKKSQLVDPSESYKNWVKHGMDKKYLGGVELLLELQGSTIEKAFVDPLIFGNFSDYKLDSLNLIDIPFYSKFLTSSLGVSQFVVTSMAIEEAYDIDLSDFDKVVRMIFLEIERIYSHLTTLSDFFWAIGLQNAWKDCYTTKSIVGKFVYSLHIDSFLATYKTEEKKNFNNYIFDLKKILDKASLVLDEWKRSLWRNQFFMDACSDKKLISSEILRHSVVGPILRSSGVNYDVRKAEGYYFYDEVEFEVPLGVEGTSYDRFLVLFEESRQSLRIISQLLDNIPAQNIDNVDILKESLKVKNGVKDIYKMIEAPHGELGFYIECSDVEQDQLRMQRLRGNQLSLISLIETILIDRQYPNALNAIAILGLPHTEYLK